MKNLQLLVFAIILCTGCGEQIRETHTNEEQQYGNTTENTKVSIDRIDNYPTYQVLFTLDKPADCFSIEIDSVYLQKSFPVQKIPARTYFIVEKKLKLPASGKKEEIIYTQLGRNFNSDWDVFSPVKVCSSANDPLSKLDISEYRIRFTTFEKKLAWYVITVTCKSKIIFSGEIQPEK